MNLDYKSLLPENFNPESRVWIYQSTRLFNLSEALNIEQKLEEFVQNWKSHGAVVKGFGTLFFGQFIVLMADEAQTGVSGCSTDSSVRLIKSIEQDTNVSLFERTNLAFVVKDKVQLLPLNQVQYAVEKGFIGQDTLFFDNSVATKQELEERWLTPLKLSWLGKRYSFA